MHMRQKYTRTNGFGTLELLLILIILAIAGLIGYYIWHTQLNHSNTTKTINTGQNAASANSQNYLTIKEWNVKLPLSNDDLSAYYVFDGTSGLTESVSIFDTTVDAFKNSNGVSCKDSAYPLFVVSRIKPSDIPATQDINSPNYIGDTGPNSFQAFPFTSAYQFAGEAPHQAAPKCEDLNPNGNFQDDTTVGSVYQKAEQALSTSFSKMQAE